MQTIINTQKETIKSVPKNVQKPITTSWILFLIFLTVSIIYFFLSQPELPLFYSVGNKQDQLVQKVFIFVFPAISLIMNIVHFFVIKILKKYSIVLIKLFVGTTLALQMLLGFALLRIILITI